MFSLHFLLAEDFLSSPPPLAAEKQNKQKNFLGARGQKMWVKTDLLLETNVGENKRAINLVNGSMILKITTKTLDTIREISC